MAQPSSKIEYYGLNTSQKATYNDLAKKNQRSLEGIRKKYKAALRKIKRAVAKDPKLTADLRSFL